jgi:uridine kinase
MATLVQISGNSGSGKTFSTMKLAQKYPEHVGFIDADGKGLA